MATPPEPPVEPFVPPNDPLPDDAAPYAWYGAEPADLAAREAAAQWSAERQSAGQWAPEATVPPDLEPEQFTPVAEQTRAARLMVGLASLAADRVRGGAGTTDAVMVTIGLLGRTADGYVALARRVSARPVRVARHGGRVVGRLPVLRRIGSPIERARRGFTRMTADARVRGQATVAAGRADARALVRSTVDDGIDWAQTEAVPRIVDGLVPQLVDEVVPRIIEGAMPEIRPRVIPVVIEDLANEPAVRELIMEQSRTVIGDAADQLRASAATADDRIESAFRRVFPGSNHEGDTPQSPDQTTEPPAGA